MPERDFGLPCNWDMREEGEQVGQEVEDAVRELQDEKKRWRDRQRV